MITRKATENLKREVGRTLQNTNICGDFKKGMCTRTTCKHRHVKFNTSPLECPICRDKIVMDTFGALTCGHILCLECASKLLKDDDTYNEDIIIECPMCRGKRKYKKLM